MQRHCNVIGVANNRVNLIRILLHETFQRGNGLVGYRIGVLHIEHLAAACFNALGPALYTVLRSSVALNACQNNNIALAAELSAMYAPPAFAASSLETPT